MGTLTPDAVRLREWKTSVDTKMYKKARKDKDEDER